MESLYPIINNMGLEKKAIISELWGLHEMSHAKPDKQLPAFIRGNAKGLGASLGVGGGILLGSGLGAKFGTIPAILSTVALGTGLGYGGYSLADYIFKKVYGEKESSDIYKNKNKKGG